MNGQEFDLIAAAHTPFAADGSLELEQVPKQAEWLAQQGVTGVFVAGTTGESLSLSISERIALAEAWRSAVGNTDFQLVVHVGAASLTDAFRLAEHAGALGVDGISAMAPCYFKPRRLADLAAFLAEVAAAGGTTPFYFYDIPKWTGVQFRSSELLAEHAADIPNFAGIKYTSDDWIDFQRCVALAGRQYKLFWGCDEALLAGLALGATGAIGSSFNFLAAQAREVIEAHRRNDYSTARAAQYRVVQIIDAIAGFDYLPASKVVMAGLGLDCGGVRLPLNPLSQAARDRLWESCQHAGLPRNSQEIGA